MTDDIARIHGAFKKLDLCPVAFLDQHIARIDAQNAALNAFAETDFATAQLAAEQSKARYISGASLGPLDGIPIAVKANMGMRGMALSAGIKGRQNIIAKDDCFAVKRLRAAGAILLGTTTMDEGAMGAAGISAISGPIKNPTSLGHSAGGSSGGSASAVAAGMCMAALGTDMLGSIRIPASFCGVVGLKPSKNLVNMDGIVPSSFTLDTLGPIARCAGDAFAVLAALLSIPYDPAKMANSISGMSFAVPQQLIEATPNISAEILAAFAENLELIKSLGGKIKNITWAELDMNIARKSAFLVGLTETAEYHGSQINAAPEGFSPGFVKLLKYGMGLRDQEKLKLASTVARAGDLIGESLSLHDAILTPTTPFPAHKNEARQLDSVAHFTALASLTATPAISVPMHISGLPLGLQIITDTLEERKAVTIAQAIEQAQVSLRSK